MIIYVSDFNIQGSGYRNIGVPLCEGLVDRGFELLVFGLGYRGEPHDYNFRLIPSKFQHLPTIVRLLPTSPELEVEAWIVALDVPLQLGLMSQIHDWGGVPWVGIFPVESDPLCTSWAMRLMLMDRCLVISEFGTVEANKAGLDAVPLPIGVDLDQWKAPSAEERLTLRQAMEVEDKFVVLTVADNQERKNLARSMEIFADFSKTHDSVYFMVTRLGSPVGWVLSDYAETLGITERFFTWERGIEQDQLRNLYGVADAFLLASKAEGLGMPVLEAMAMELPVVATKCTALEDHLKNRRGFLVEPDYVFVDPWGNSHRYMMGREAGVEALAKLAAAPSEAIERLVERAFTYVEGRSWSKGIDVLEKALLELGATKGATDGQ